MDRPPPIGIGSHQVVAFKAVTAGRYRVDFLLVIHETRLLAVECDGHEWHERTKQQASGDRARDRDLLRTGILTARYTGSDIASDPDGCAADLLDIVVSQGTAAMGIRSSIRRVRRAALGRRPPLDVDGDYIAGAMSEIG
jgi:very-short-patch-repair endonuclease